MTGLFHFPEQHFTQRYTYISSHNGCSDGSLIPSPPTGNVTSPAWFTVRKKSEGPSAFSPSITFNAPESNIKIQSVVVKGVHQWRAKKHMKLRFLNGSRIQEQLTGQDSRSLVHHGAQWKQGTILPNLGDSGARRRLWNKTRGILLHAKCFLCAKHREWNLEVTQIHCTAL